ncbi:MAG: 2-methylcitrate dehydratase [Hyphomicrobiales bacterium]|nr:MAG: 2-methylcitrate dehydratase [Hyphomicrobiales bacterium]
MTTTIEALAAYVHAARAVPLTAEAREAALRCILDLVAAAAAGVDAPGPRAARRAASVLHGAGDYPIWFTGQRSSLLGAVWANCSAAAALDIDDGHRIARGHPGAAIIPAAFAIAQQVGASAEDLLKAIVVGYEVGVAVGAARRFYANTGMWSGYGVIAAAGLLKGTPSDQLAQAFAIAGASAPNQLHAGAGPAFPALEGTDVKEGIPWSDVTAISALALAENGHCGPVALLDTDSHFRTAEIAAGLGSRLYIARSYFKFLSCCRHVHAPVEALLDLMARHDITADTIEAIAVDSYSGALRLTNRPDPQGFTEVQFSIPYCLGLVALHGREALLPLTEDLVERPEIVAIARKVSLRLDPEIEARFPAETLTRVTVEAAGRRYISEVTGPRGEASAPPSWQQLEEKLRVVTRRTAGDVQWTELLGAVQALREGDHDALFAAFRDLRLGGARASA